MYAIQKMFEHVYTRFFFRDMWFLGTTFLGVLFFVFQCYLLFFGLSTLYQPGRDYIALHTKQFFGVDFYSEWYMVFIIPITGLAIFLVNFIVARNISSSRSTFFYALCGVSLWSQIVLCIVLYRIIQLNAF